MAATMIAPCRAAASKAFGIKHAPRSALHLSCLSTIEMFPRIAVSAHCEKSRKSQTNDSHQPLATQNWSAPDSNKISTSAARF